MYMQEVHTEETDLSPLSPRAKFSLHTDQFYCLLLMSSPEMPLIRIITFLITTEVPTQGDKSTLWPTCLPQHESFTTLSSWYDCSCTHPICQCALFPATCCAFLEITKSISAHDNAFKAPSHISPHLLFVNDTATELELENRAASVKWLKIPLGYLL